MLKNNREHVKKILSFTDEVNGEEVILDMYRSLKFSDDINRDMESLLIGYQYSGMLEAIAETRYETLHTELDQLAGNLDEYARECDAILRPTDSKVKAWINRNEDYIKKRKALIKAKEKLMMYKHFNQAFKIKAELIRTRAANLRIEYNDLGMAMPTVPTNKKNKSGGSHGG